MELKNDELEKKFEEKIDLWKLNKKAELEKMCESEKQAVQEALNSRCNEFNADEVYHSEMDGRKTVHYKCVEAFECQHKIDKEVVGQKIVEFLKELKAEKDENLEQAAQQNDLNFAELQNDFKQERVKFLASINSMLEPFVNDDIKVAGLDGMHGEL